MSARGTQQASLEGESFSEAGNEVSLQRKQGDKRGRRWRWHASEGGGYSSDRTEVREWARASRDARRVGHVRHVRRVSESMQVITKKGELHGQRTC